MGGGRPADARPRHISGYGTSAPSLMREGAPPRPDVGRVRVAAPAVLLDAGGGCVPAPRVGIVQY
jgi:hypothetical protein